MDFDGRPVAALVLGILSGALILLGSIVVLVFGSMNIMATMMNMMGMGGVTWTAQTASFFNWFAIFGLASGAVVLIGSLMLYQRPMERQLWGGVILGFSVLSIIGAMGGFMVGFILGIISGILALTWTKGPIRPATL